MIIGITGQIGSGKSTASNVFKKLGAALIDADKIGREVVEQNPQLVRKIARVFGRDTVTSNGKLKRARVAEIAFANKKNKQKLDRLVHPYLLKKLKQQIRKLNKVYDVIVIDAALLLDWNLEKVADRILVIHAPLEKRIARLMKRGIKRRDAVARQKMQLPFNEFKKCADKVIRNNTTQKEFENKVRLWAGQFFS